MRDEVYNLKQEVEQIREESFAMGILKDYKKANKRLFIIILILLVGWFITGVYLVYTISDTGTYEIDSDMLDVQDVDTIDNSTIKIGDDTWDELR